MLLWEWESCLHWVAGCHGTWGWGKPFCAGSRFLPTHHFPVLAREAFLPQRWLQLAESTCHFAAVAREGPAVVPFSLFPYCLTNKIARSSFRALGLAGVGWRAGELAGHSLLIVQPLPTPLEFQQLAQMHCVHLDLSNLNNNLQMKVCKDQRPWHEVNNLLGCDVFKRASFLPLQLKRGLLL